MEFTPEQEAVFEAYQSRRGHLFVPAVAGAGKSTLLIENLKRNPEEQVVILPFGKRDAEHLKSKVENLGLRNVTVRTVHSVGYEMCREWWDFQYRMFSKDISGWQDMRRDMRSIHDERDFWDRDVLYPRKRMNVNQYKVKNILINEAGFHPQDDYPQILFYEKVVDLLRSYLISGDVSEIDLAEEILDGHGYTLREKEYIYVMGTIAHSNWLFENNGELDFNDMIIQPVRFDLPAPLGLQNPDRLVADELQDWNEIQRIMTQKFIGDRTLFFGVGDPDQEIYSFRGARDSFQKTINMVQSMDDIPVESIRTPDSFRCPQRHAELAKAYVPDFRSAVDREGDIQYINPEDVVHLIQPGDIFYARRTAPLVSLMVRIILSDPSKSITVIGNNIVPRIIDVIDDIKDAHPDEFHSLSRWLRDYNEKFVEELTEDLHRRIERYRTKAHRIAITRIRQRYGLDYRIPDWQVEDLAVDLIAKYTDKMQRRLRDKQDDMAEIMLCIQSIMRLGATDYMNLIAQIRDLFDDENADIVGSSIHRVKGREAHRCFYINYDATMGDESKMSPEDQAEENRIRYVALTRSLDTLYLVREESNMVNREFSAIPETSNSLEGLISYLLEE